MTNTATLCDDWDSADGVELDAILFGGRRASNVPLVVQSRSWEHGVFMGATISSEQTAAAEGPVGVLRRDPFAMLPFCGYNMADYFSHWLEMKTDTTEELMPKIFQVNWFRKGSDGRFLWPGFGENSRVIEWVVSRLENQSQGMQTPIGLMPRLAELNLEGLEFKPGELEELFDVDPESWLYEVRSIEQFFERFGEKLPSKLRGELIELEARLLQEQGAMV